MWCWHAGGGLQDQARRSRGYRCISQTKGGVMKRTLLLLMLLGIGVGVTTPASAQDLINGALTALGGADALMQVKTLVVKGTVR